MQQQFILITSQTSVTITCGIQMIGDVTMATKCYINNTCNMCIRDLPDMNALIPRACGPWALGIHIRQIPHAHACYNNYLLKNNS